jgi:hypothetical protein
MSVMSNDSVGKIKGLCALTKSNFLDWIQHVGDMLLAIDHADAGDMWDDYLWVVDPNNIQPDPITRDWQDSSTPTLKKLKPLHNLAWAKIRNSLDPITFKSTVDVKRSVPKLLRHLRNRWNNGSTEDRNGVRETFTQMKLEQFSDIEEFVIQFKAQLSTMRDLGIKMADSDLDVLFCFNKALPKAWATITMVAAAQQLGFEAATEFYISQAKQDSTLPGSISKGPKGSHAVHWGKANNDNTSNDVCRQFARGHCPRGNTCKYKHVALPGGNASHGSHGNHGGNKNGGGHNKGAQRSAGKKFEGDCRFCGKKGHKESDCYAKKRDQAGKDSSHKTDDAKTDGNASHTTTDGNKDAPATWIDGFAYSFVPDVQEITLAMRKALKEVAHTDNGLLLVLDGASTIGVVEDETLCVDIQDVNLFVKVGGNGKPHLVVCKKIGILPIDTTTDGRRIRVNLPVRIIPGFGVNIIPECHFLQHIGYSVNKTGNHVEIMAPDGKAVLRGEALKYDSSWLFYIKVGVNSRKFTDKALVCQTVSTTIVPASSLPVPSFIPMSYTMEIPDGETERNALLPLGDFPESLVYKTDQDLIKLLTLHHQRNGHRNLRDCALQLGVQVPSNMPPCISCIKCKAKRQPLTGSSGIHFSPRAGHTIAWDHAGPFAMKTLGGNNIMSLKVDVFSGLLFIDMTNSTGSATDEWIEFVLRQEADRGKQMVSQMITDSAPYFESNKLIAFNKAKGIVHVQSPPYTQELNGLAERSIGTILGMAKTAMDAANAPPSFAGECLIAMGYVANRNLHKTGGRLSRLEKWEGRLLPNQRDKLRVWGSAAFVLLDYGPRGKIGPIGKLAPNSQLHFLAGYDPYEMGYRCFALPGFKLRTALHIQSIEGLMPLVTKLNIQLEDFLTPGQAKYYQQAMLEVNTDQPEPLCLPEKRGDRVRIPSRAALEAIAAGAPEAPDVADDVVNMAKQVDQLDQIYVTWYETVLNTSGSVSAHEALATDFKLVSPALNREVLSHLKNGTLGPALDSIPAGHKAIPFDCIFKLKRDGRPKCRGIIKGFHLKRGIDYNETYAPVPCLSIMRFFFAWSAYLNWEIKQGDVHTAFLTADMDTEIYVKVPNWFKVDATGTEPGYTVRRLLKAIPGIPQGPRLFYKKTNPIFRGLELLQCTSEYCLYYCPVRKIYLVIWVDDLFTFFPTTSMEPAAKLWKGLQKDLDLDDWQDIGDCLSGMVKRDRPNRILSVSQETGIRKLLEHASPNLQNTASTPMVANTKLSKKDCPSPEEAAVMVDGQHWYRWVIASFIWFANYTRPDWAYPVSKLCKYMHNPGHTHIVALKHLLRHACGTQNVGLVYDFSGYKNQGNQPKINGFYDASHADDLDTRKSTTAYVFLLGDCPISWHTKLNTVLTTSTNHSEYCAAAKAAREAKWWEKVCTEIGFAHCVKPVDLFSDSKGSIAMTYNPVLRSASKHVDLADHYVREQQELGTITTTWVSTKHMLADALTKALAHIDFSRHAGKLVAVVLP